MLGKQKDLDDLQERIGGLSRYQIIVCIAATYIGFTTTQASQVAVFLSAVPDFRCAIPSLDGSASNLTEEEIRNYTIPLDSSGEYDTCWRYDLNLTNCHETSCIPSTNDVIKCDNGYHYDQTYYTRTTITEWNLVCDRRLLDTMANSLFFFGFFLGSAAHGPIADWLGRKWAMLIFTIEFLVANVSLAFVPYFWLFVVLRVFSGMALIGAFVANFTFVNEISSTKHRMNMSLMVFILAFLGHLLLAGLGYWLRDWQDLILTCGLLPVPFFLILAFLPESPRWLLTKGRTEEAKKVVLRYVKSRGATMTDEEWNQIVDSEKEKRSKSAEESARYSLLDLFKQPRMRIVSLVVMLGWFTTNVVFYGLTLNVGSLAGDPYVNFTLNTLIELGGILIVFIAPYTGKRNLLCASFLFAGLVCLGSTVCNEFANGRKAVIDTGVALAILGKLGGQAMFTLIYAISSDVYPTVVRGTGIGLGSMAARVGGVLTPFTIELQNILPWLTQTVFGVLSIITFVISVLLPETNKITCLTTMEEAEEFYNEKMHIWNKITRTKRPDLEKNSYDNDGADITEL